MTEFVPDYTRPTPEYVRVKDKSTGYHLSILRGQLDADPEAFTELKQDATDVHGLPLPPDFSKAPSGHEAATTKEK